MLLMQKQITISKQCIFIDNKEHQVIDYNDERNNSIFDDNFLYYSMKLEQIPNISDVYNLFLMYYAKLYPSINIYYYNKRDNFADLIKFIRELCVFDSPIIDTCKNTKYYSIGKGQKNSITRKINKDERFKQSSTLTFKELYNLISKEEIFICLDNTNFNNVFTFLRNAFADGNYKVLKKKIRY